MQEIHHSTQYALLLKKKKNCSLILCRFKSPPWGFLFINYFKFFSLFCLWMEHQCKLVYTHNAKQIKNRDDRGNRWIQCSPHPCSFEELRCSRTNLYNINAQHKKNDCMRETVTASDDLLWRIIVWNILHALERVATFSRGLEMPHQPRCRVKLLVRLTGWIKWESLLKLFVTYCMLTCGYRCVVVSFCAFTLIRTPVCMCLQVRLWCAAP